ncbi:excalibur calcium-binding domain-containing protein [Schaalia suimastitidis]
MPGPACGNADRNPHGGPVPPIYEGQSGYSRKLDRDGNGVACEK